MLIFAVGAIGFGALTIWTWHEARTRRRAFMTAYARAVAVTGTITKVDRAVDSKKLQPTYAYRTTDGQHLVSRSKVVFSGNRNEQATYVVGASMPVRYDPEQPDWVIPESGNLQQVKLHAYSMPLSFACFTALMLLCLALPE